MYIKLNPYHSGLMDWRLFMETSKYIYTNETITLYHGSKSGIQGNITPKSREHCDFGKGFYMGIEKSQPLTLICNYPNPSLYTLNLDLSELTVLNLNLDLDWALFVAYNRGKMDMIKGLALYNKYENLSKNYDIIAGYIANDRMFVVLDRFFNGIITDVSLIHCLSALKLGKQYVALTDKACSKIKILNEQVLTEDERKELKQKSEANRSKGISLAEEICRKHRREGRFFDEILNTEN